ncbi:MAG: hypothetical protein HY537_13100 [Deltaproteobacteria bacterium]|nr:hypothetical protein [Deltaproteobacteria bacterium]
MVSSGGKLLALLVPTLCLFYTFSWSRVPPMRHYHQTFGNGDYYLDVYFDLNPVGYFQRGLAHQDVPFSGYLVSSDTEWPVSGRFIRKANDIHYYFASQLGLFKGILRNSETGCEPNLYFNIYKEEKAIRSGVLKGGFCQ